MYKSWEISVSVAAPSIRDSLLLNANVSVFHTSKSTGERWLRHNAAMRPIKALPWPLSKAQTHDIEFSVTGSPIYSDGCDRFPREQMNLAIDFFLADLSQNDLISITIK